MIPQKVNKNIFNSRLYIVFVRKAQVLVISFTIALLYSSFPGSRDSVTQPAKCNSDNIHLIFTPGLFFFP